MKNAGIVCVPKGGGQKRLGGGGRCHPQQASTAVPAWPKLCLGVVLRRLNARQAQGRAEVPVSGGDTVAGCGANWVLPTPEQLGAGPVNEVAGTTVTTSRRPTAECAPRGCEQRGLKTSPSDSSMSYRDVGGPLWIAPGDTLFSQNIADITGLYGQGSSPMATHLGASPRFLSDADRRQRGGAVSTSICIDVGTHGCIASCLTGPIASLDESSAFSARDVAGGLECANSDTHVAGAVGVFMHCAIARLESDLPACQHLRKKWIC